MYFTYGLESTYRGEIYPVFRRNLAKCEWDVAKWLELLAVNCKVLPGFDPSILRYSRIQKIQKNPPLEIYPGIADVYSIGHLMV